MHQILDHGLLCNSSVLKQFFASYHGLLFYRHLGSLIGGFGDCFYWKLLATVFYLPGLDGNCTSAHQPKRKTESSVTKTYRTSDPKSNHGNKILSTWNVTGSYLVTGKMSLTAYFKFKSCLTMHAALPAIPFYPARELPSDSAR